MSDHDLLQLQSHKNEWFVRQARRELANRAALGQPLGDVRAELLDLLGRSADPVGRLRALWTLRTIGPVNPGVLEGLLGDRDESVRTWAIRIRTESWPIDSVVGQPRAESVEVPAGLLERFAKMAREDDSGLVRLTLASTLQRLPVDRRAPLASALSSRREDADDPSLPPLVWYGLIPVAARSPRALIPIAVDGKFPKLRRWVARRFAEVLASKPGLLDALLAAAERAEETVRSEIVLGISEGLAGVRKASPPPRWEAFAKALEGPEFGAIRSAVLGLDVVFGDGRAIDEVRRIALDPKAALEIRKSALGSLIEARPADLRSVCESLLGERFLNSVALRGLAIFDDPAVADRIARSYRAFHPSERGAVIESLATRPGSARVLLDQMLRGSIPRSDLSASQARQIRGFGDPGLSASLARVWGELRDSPREKADLIASYRAALTPEVLARADRSRGRAIFEATCAGCHRLFGSGAEVGPDLTGSGRKDLDYLLSNVVDPGAVVNKDFQLSILGLKDGRILNGIVLAETDQTLTIRTAQALLTLPRDEVEARSSSALSLMPDGLLQPLDLDRVRDLIAYLMSDAQVAAPPAGPAPTPDGR